MKILPSLNKKSLKSKVKDYFLTEYNFNIVKFIEKKDEWYYYSGTKKGRPHYSSLPIVIRINQKGIIERVKENIRYKLRTNEIKRLF